MQYENMLFEQTKKHHRNPGQNGLTSYGYTNEDSVDILNDVILPGTLGSQVIPFPNFSSFFVPIFERCDSLSVGQ